MAIELDGEKYACEACVRGHRVSNCTHRDRELKHINKKGRPVSQCPHCRGLRKSRAAHVKCVCAELGPNQANATNAQTAGSSVQTPCGCMHGQSCNCSHKSQQHTEVNEIARTAAMNATHRRSASNGKPAMAYRRSDSTVPGTRHSFHPPLHRMNHAAHEHGMPYPLKRASASHGDLGMSAAQRSVDSLPLQANSTSGLQLGNWPPIPQMSNQDLRLAKSAQNSPMVQTPAQFEVGAAPRQGDPSFFSRSMSPANPQRYSMNDFTQFEWNGNFNAGGEFGPTLSTYAGMASSVPSSATESLPMSWSELDLANSYNYNAMAQQNPQPPSVDSVDQQPSLSRSSSGTASDTAESSNTNFADFGFGISQPSLDSLSWQSASWQADSAFDAEDAFNLQKTPRAPHPDNHMGNMDDYFGNFGGASTQPQSQQAQPNQAQQQQMMMMKPEPDMMSPQWSSASPEQSSGLGGVMMPTYASDASEAWSSQLDLSSYAQQETSDAKTEQSGSGEVFSWS